MITEKQIEREYVNAVKLALWLVETEARKILRAHDNLDEFIMGMGRYFFTRKPGSLRSDGSKVSKEESEIIYDEPKYIASSRLVKFIGSWDEYLKLTGCPMRFTANGSVVTDW